MQVATYPLIVNLILEKDGKVLCVYREHTKTYNKLYGLPAGKVEKGESLRQNIIREAYEEVGITILPEDLELAITLYAKYTYNEKLTEDVGFFFKVTKYQGEVVNAEPHKHSHIQWIDLDSLPKDIVPHTRVALEAYVQGKSYMEYEEE